MVIKHYSGTNTPKPRFIIIFDYSEWSKNHRVFSIYMQDYIQDDAGQYYKEPRRYLQY